MRYAVYAKNLRFWRPLSVAGLVVLAAAAAVQACSVPVFRYALERWQVDPYEVHVFHRGDLTPEQQQVLQRLKDVSVEEQPDGVVDLWISDLVKADPDGEAGKVWEAHKASAALPWVVVRYPRMFGIPIDTWSGRLTKEAIDLLLDSPTRRQVAKLLLEGETTVFVLLESGDKKEDAAVAARLATQLKRMEELIEPPEPPGGVWGDPIYDTEGAPQLKIAFSIVPLSRDDPAEAGFRNMLLGCEPGLKKETGPMAFPIFGRGRVLCALVGEGISELNIEEVCGFVASPCSCVVKYQNPGVDMLLNVRWDAALMGEQSAIPDVKLPPLTGLAKFAQAAEIESGAQTPREDEAGAAEPQPAAVGLLLGLPWVHVIGGVAAGLVGLLIVALLSIVVWKRSKRSEG